MFSSLGVLPPQLEPLFDRKPKPRVLVIGYGWAGKAFVDNLDRRQYSVKVISQTEQRLNQPQMIYALRPRWTDPTPETHLINDTCQLIDKAQRRVACTRVKSEYDYLVIASGAETNTFNIPGVDEHAYKFKSADDVSRLNAVLPSVSQVTIVGSGPTGVELACRLHQEGKRVEIIEAMPSILPGFSDQMRNRVLELLQQRSIDVRVNTKVTAVTPTPDRITVWVAGVRPTGFIRQLTDNKPLITDDRLQLTTEIYAIGDVVVGRGPPTAQNAKQQGVFLARHFNNGRPTTDSYQYTEHGRILDMSDCLLVEYRGYLFTLPAFARSLLHAITD